MKPLLIVLSFVSFITKIILHIYLDIKHNKFDGLKPANFLPIAYFFPYMSDVIIKYSSQKKICNVAYWLFIIIIIVISIVKQFIP